MGISGGTTGVFLEVKVASLRIIRLLAASRIIQFKTKVLELVFMMIEL